MTQTQTTSPVLTPEEARVRRAHLVVCVTLLAVVAGTYLGVVALSAPELPDRLAVHFGLDGRSDGWLDTTVALVSFGLLGAGLPAVLLGIFAAGQWWRGSSARLTSALVCGLGAALVALFGGLLWVQRGLEQATEVRLDGWTVLWPLVAGAAVGLLAASLLPRSLPQPEPAPAEPMAIAPSDKVSWFDRTGTPQPIVVVLLLAVLLVVAVTIATAIWWLWLLVMLLLLLLPATTDFRVTIDREGLTWRSALGLPRGRVPLSDVTEVSVVDVRPGDYGGYGIRSVPGTLALVTRHGPALRVRRTRGSSFVVTLTDPVTAASVLEGLRRRA